MKARAFSIILLSFVAGIFLAPFFDIEISIFKYLVLGIFIVAVIFFRKNIWIRTALISLAVFFLAILRYEAIQPKNEPSRIGYYNGQKVEIVGVIDSEPETDKVTKFIVDAKSVNGKGVNGKILVTVRNFPEHDFGEKIKISGELKEPPDFEDFSYKNYLSRFGVYSVVSFSEIEKTKSQFVNRDFSENLWFQIRLQLNNLRKTFEKSIEESLPEPHASFMNGLILGSKKSIPDWLMDDFKTTGTSHVVALSGFNITIIVFVLRNITHSLSRKLSFWIPVLGVFLFVILTGAAASVVRAAIMGSMLLLAKRFGRQSTAFIAVTLSAAAMLYLNPLILRFDIGFQLSFAAVIGLIYIAPFLEKYLLWLPKIISENLSLTLAAQTAALPILVSNFGQLSLVAPIANILILPLIPVAMLFGFVAATFGIIFSPLGRILGYISFALLDYMIKVVGLLSKINFADISFETKGPFFAIIYYIILADILLLIKFKQKQKRAYEREV